MAVNLGSAEGTLDLDISGFVSALKDAQAQAAASTDKIESAADGLGASFKSAGQDAGDGFVGGLESGLSGVKGGFDPVEEEADKTKGPMKDSGKESGEEFIDGLKSALAGAVVAGAFAGVVASASELTSVANETEEDMGKLATAAKFNGVQVEASNSAYRNMVGILGETDQSVEAVNHLFALCGDNTARLSQWTDIAAGVYGVFGDSLPLEGLTEAANETARVGQVTGPFADALNWAVKNSMDLASTLPEGSAAQRAFNAAIAEGSTAEDAYTAALKATSDESERAQLITDTLSSIYQEAGQTYRDVNGNVIAYRESQDALKQTMSDFGGILMPIQTEVTNLGVSFLQDLQPAVQWLADNIPGIKDTFVQFAPAIAGVAAGFAAFQTFTAIAGIITGVKTALDGMTVSQALLNAVMNANPIMIVVTLLATLGAALATLWATNEDFRNFVTSAWNSLLSTATSVFGRIGSFFTSDLPRAISAFIAAVGAIPGRVASAFVSVLSSAASFVGSFASSAINAASSFVGNLISGLASLPGQVYSIGSNIVHGIWNGISGAANWLFNKITSFAGGLVDSAMNALGIKSPSRVFADKVGKWIPAGVAKGAEDATPEAFSDIEDAFVGAANDMSLTGMIAAFTKPFDTMSSSMRGSFAQLAASGNAVMYGGAVPYQPRRKNKGYTPSEPVYAGGTGGGDTYNFYSPKAIDEVEAAKQMKRAKRELAEGFY